MSINYPSSLLPTPAASGAVLTSNGTSWVSAPAQGGGISEVRYVNNSLSYILGTNGENLLINNYESSEMLLLDIPPIDAVGSTTFTDVSPQANTVVTQGTISVENNAGGGPSPKSIFSNNPIDKLYITNTEFAFGTGGFTMEAEFYVSGAFPTPKPWLME